MIITEVEALHLRQTGSINEGIADGSQDALIVRVHTDAGIVGLGEVDSHPLVAKAVIEAPASQRSPPGCAPSYWVRIRSRSDASGRRCMRGRSTSGAAE